MSVQRKKRANLRELVMMAVFAALAFAAMFVFRFNVTFLTFDLKDSIITIAGLIMGIGSLVAVGIF